MASPLVSLATCFREVRRRQYRPRCHRARLAFHCSAFARRGPAILGLPLFDPPHGLARCLDVSHHHRSRRRPDRPCRACPWSRPSRPLRARCVPQVDRGGLGAGWTSRSGGCLATTAIDRCWGARPSFIAMTRCARPCAASSRASRSPPLRRAQSTDVPQTGRKRTCMASPPRRPIRVSVA